MTKPIKSSEIPGEQGTHNSPLKQMHFFLARKEALELKKKAQSKLSGKNWQPWNSEIADVLVVPNNDLTCHIILKFANEKEVTLFEFMKLHGMRMSDLE
jgi:hypothetical protein